MKSYGQTLVLLLTALIMAACSHVPAEEGTQQPKRAARGVGLPLAAGLAAERREAAETAAKPESPKPAEPAPEPTPEPAQQPETAADDSPGFFARLFGWGEEEKTDAPAEAEKKTADVQPTPAQQAAAHKLLDAAAIPEPALVTDAAPEPATRNGLRLGRFAPPEEGTDAAETPAPRPNKVELRGLRSPMLPGGKLPMDINGKLTTDNHD